MRWPSEVAERIESEYRSALNPSTNTTQSYDVLVLSGGGAFGASFLEHLSKNLNH